MSYYDLPHPSEDMQRFKADLIKHIEMMAAAYLKATDIPPEECELVVEQTLNGYVYRFRKQIKRKEEE